MSVTLSLTESAVLTVLRSFLLDVLPAGTECVQGQSNRVPEPEGDNFVVFTPIFRKRLETTTNIYTDVADPVGNPSGTNSATAPTELTVQVDFHGPSGGDNAQIVTTLFRDEFAAIFFKQAGIAAAPLYADEARQMPFLNGEQQIEDRWCVDVAIQINPTVTTPQAFASTLGPITLFPVA
jgi:hypothetical protein